MDAPGQLGVPGDTRGEAVPLGFLAVCTGGPLPAKDLAQELGLASKAKSLTSLAACVDLEKLSNYKKREVRLCCEGSREGRPHHFLGVGRGSLW